MEEVMTKEERRDQRIYKAYRKTYFGRRNNRKSLEQIIQARNRRLAIYCYINIT